MTTDSITDGESDTSIVAHEDLVRRFIASNWNGNDIHPLGSMTTPNLFVHGLGDSVDRSAAEIEAFYERPLEAVPDLRHEVRSIVAENDQGMVVVFIRGRPDRQSGDSASTVESFDSEGFQQDRRQDGRIAAVWVLPEAVGVVRQIGILSGSPTTAPTLELRVLQGRLVRR